MLKTLLSISLLLALTACASASAKSPSDRPALEVPPPPPRVIEPPPPVEAPADPVGDLPPATPAAPPKPKPQPRESGRETAKPEPKSETPAEAPQPAPTPPVQAPESQLRMPGSADGAEAARQIAEILDRARKLLSAVNFRNLVGERLKAFNEAKEFMKGAEDAVQKQNYIYARSLADKAEKLARELQGR
jgi:outer membrane biosynthesis protein TonB